MVSSGSGKKMSIFGGPFLGQQCVGDSTLHKLTLDKELHGPCTDDGNGDALLEFV
jgi:hypothetical protein